jgi:hypothetical protein
MNLITNPVIHHVAQTTLDQDGVDQFLLFFGIEDWETDAPSDSEYLIELAGRRCIPEGALIRLSDCVKTIENVRIGEFVCIHDKMYKVVNTFYNGVQDVFRVRTNAGYMLESTKNHRIKLIDGTWKTLEDLSVGKDVLAMNTLSSSNPNTDFNSEFLQGYCCGLFLGDGTFAGVNFSVANLRLFKEKKQLMSLVKTVLSIDPVYQPDRDIWSFNSTEWARDLFRYGIYHGRRCFTKEIETSSLEFQRGVLRGYFDTDGHLETCYRSNGSLRNRRVNYCSSTHKNLRRVQRMLLNFGIFSRFRDDTRQGKHLFPGDKTYVTNLSWKLTITGKNFLKFFDTIGSFRQEKLDAFTQAINASKRWGKDPLPFSRVKSIEYVGKKKVFDLSIEHIHQFPVNGILVHNCYNSFETPSASATDLNKNLTKVRKGNTVYIGNIIDVNHGAVIEHTSDSYMISNVPRVFCYHPHTEVLTKSGWKSITELSSNDMLWTKNPVTKTDRWSPILSLHDFDYDGLMYGFQNTEITSPLMTTNHLLWAARYDLRKHRGLSCREMMDFSAEKIPFSEMYTKRFVIDHIFQPESSNDSETIRIGQYIYDTYTLFKWLGWITTDGSFSKDRPNQCSIIQNKCGNFDEIRQIMNELFKHRWREHGPYENTQSKQFTISNSAITEFARKNLGSPLKRDRSFSEFILNASPRLLRGFLSSALKGDGTVHKENGHQTLYCCSSLTADQWQFILAKLGIASNIRIDDRIGDCHKINGNLVTTKERCWQVNFHRRSNTTLVKKHSQYELWYTGKVYCPKTDDGIIFVRQKGLPFWSCNTHEQVRHRVGVAYSQESLRYVRFANLSLCFPHVFQQLEEKERDVVETLFRQTGAYLETIYAAMEKLLFSNDKKISFAEKKRLTSGMRYLMPMGMSTGILVSGNHRAWRHMIELRTSRHAEDWIRDAYGIIARDQQTRYPNLFQDMTGTEVEGLMEYTFGK